MSELKKPIIISFFNNKGGVGKSTLSCNQASVFADKYNVLLIDNDPQGNVSEMLGQEQNAEIKKVYQGKDFKIHPIDFNASLIELERRRRTDKRLSIITGGMDLLDVETEVRAKPKYKTILKNNLKEAIKDFDYVFIDNQPAINALTWNALYMSDFVIIPFKPALSEFSGIKKLYEIIGELKQEMNHELKILGILVNMYTSNFLSDKYVKLLRETFDEKMLFKSGVRVAQDYMKAMLFGLPVDLLYAKSDPVVEMMLAVKEEILEKLEKKIWI